MSVSVLGGFPAKSDPAENLILPWNPEDPGGADVANPGIAGGAHDDSMHDDAVDGEELMIRRVPRLPLEPSARQIAEHKLTGHALYSSCAIAWCRRVDYRFFGRDRENVLSILRVKCRNSSTGCMPATGVERKGASDCAKSYRTACIARLGSREEDLGEFRH